MVVTVLVVVVVHLLTRCACLQMYHCNVPREPTEGRPMRDYPAGHTNNEIDRWFSRGGSPPLLQPSSPTDDINQLLDDPDMPALISSDSDDDNGLSN